MLSWAIMFLVIVLIAGVLGLSGITGTATHIQHPVMAQGGTGDDAAGRFRGWSADKGRSARWRAG
jgi:hypothetical protein